MVDGGSTREAIDVYSRALHASRAPAATNDGNEVRAYAKMHYHLAQACLKERRWKQAVESLQQVVELNPLLGDYYHSYRICEDGGASERVSSTPRARAQQLDEVRQHVEGLRNQVAARELLSSEDDDVQAVIELANLKDQLGDRRAAQAAIDLAASHARLAVSEKGEAHDEPVVASAYIGFGDEAKRLDVPEQADVFYEVAGKHYFSQIQRALSAADPSPIEGAFDIIAALRERGHEQWAKEIAHATADLAAAAGAQRLDAAAGNLASQHVLWGDRFEANGFEKLAGAQWDLAASLAISAVRVGLACELDITATSLFELAVELTRRGANASADDVIDAIDEVMGDDVVAFNALARNMTQKGLGPRVLRLWPTMLGRQPYYFEGWRDYALALADAGETRRGLQALNHAIGLDASRRAELLALYGQHVNAQRDAHEGSAS